MLAETHSFDEMLDHVRDFVEKNTIVPLEKGDLYVISAGIPFGKTGTTNMVLVQKV